VAQEFTALYREHYPAVLRFVRRRASPADVDDIVAETFTTAWRKQDEMAIAPLPWLYRTARNSLLNAARADGRRTALHVRMAQDTGGDTGRDPASLISERRRLSDAWHRLDHFDREVLALQAWEGMSSSESAAILGISRAACSMRTSRARRRLSALLAAADADPLADADAAASWPSTPNDLATSPNGAPHHV
jgi:RNA polymerase sigma factor (sigma-70 family)